MKRVARAVLAAVTIVAALIGVPILLAVIAGWPLPTSMPDWSRVYWSARQGDIPAEFVIKALACIAWLAWAQIAWALVWELFVNVPRAMRGRAERTVPLAPAPASRLARRLVTAAMVLTTITSTPATSAAAPALSSLVSTTGSGGHVVAAAVVDTAAPATVAATAESPTGWRVVSGDTLWDIAERCLGDGSHVDEIVKCNPNLDTARPLQSGQLIELPAGVVAPADRSPAPTVETPPPASEAAVSETRHIVRTDETLWGIVEDAYGHADWESVSHIAQLNAIQNPSLILVGQEIVLPNVDAVTLTPVVDSPAVAATGVEAVHTVVKGDTLWDIVNDHYGVADSATVWGVANANHLENPSLILPGQRIVLPNLNETAGVAPAVVEDTPPPPVVAEPVEDASVDPAPEVVEEVPVDAAPVDYFDLASDDVAAPETDARDEVVSATAEGEAAVEPAPVPPDVDPEKLPPAATSTPLPPPPLTEVAVVAEDAPVAAPATTSSPSTSPTPVEVAASDKLSSRWLFGGLMVTSLALVGAWMTVARMRRRRRRWLGVTGPDRETSAMLTDREQAAEIDVVALSALVDPHALRVGTARAVVLGDRPEIRFRGEAPDAAAGWDRDGSSWWWAGDQLDPDVEPVLSSALVTIGRGEDGIGDVILDLCAAGTVSVTGDRVAVERLMCSMLWELASDPFGHPVDLRVVGLACAAARHTANSAQLVSLDEAIAAAHEPVENAARVQVFLVDPFADDTATGSLRELAEACGPGTGRCVVVAGPCEHPVEEVTVSSAQRAMWDGLALSAPQLPEDVDVELGRMLDAITIGRRDDDRRGETIVIPDIEAEAVALRTTAVLVEQRSPGSGDYTDDDDDGAVADEPVIGGTDDDVDDQLAFSRPVSDVAGPEVMLSVCGRVVGVHGYDVQHSPSVLFLLAAAGRPLHDNEVSELTGYAAKSLGTVFPSSHELVVRDSGMLQLAEQVWTDHGWATECVRQLARAMNLDAGSDDVQRWMLATLDALGALEQGPFAVLPAQRNRSRANTTAWGWVDDFPEAAPARTAAETEVAEAALAWSELWLTAPATHAQVRRADVVGELCRLAGTVPYAHVARQIRKTPWTAGAECLLAAAARVADADERARVQVQQTARALAAREQLEASDELADALGL